jgi:hypothetical protein
VTLGKDRETYKYLLSSNGHLSAAVPRCTQQDSKGERVIELAVLAKVL